MRSLGHLIVLLKPYNISLYQLPTNVDSDYTASHGSVWVTTVACR